MARRTTNVNARKVLQERVARGDEGAAGALRTLAKAEQKTAKRTRTGGLPAQTTKSFAKSERQQRTAQRFAKASDFQVAQRAQAKAQRPTPRPQKLTETPFGTVGGTGRPERVARRGGGILAAKDIAAGKVGAARASFEGLDPEDFATNEDFLKAQVNALLSGEKARKEGFAGVGKEIQEAAAFEEARPREDLEAEFLETTTSKLLARRKDIETSKLENLLTAERERIGEEERRAGEAERRAAISSAALRGAVGGGVGFVSNVELTEGLQREGRESLERLKRQNRLDLQGLITKGEELRLGLDVAEAQALDQFIVQEQEEVRQRNVARNEAVKDQRAFERQRRMDDLAFSKFGLDTAKFFQQQQVQKKAEERTQLEFQSKESQRQFDNIAKKFNIQKDFLDLAQDRFGKGALSDALLTQIFAEQGIEVPEEMLDITSPQEFEDKLNLLSKFAKIDPAFIGMLGEIKNEELGIREGVTIDEITKTARDAQRQGIFDVALARAAAEGQIQAQQLFFGSPGSLGFPSASVGGVVSSGGVARSPGISGQTVFDEDVINTNITSVYGSPVRLKSSTASALSQAQNTLAQQGIDLKVADSHRGFSSQKASFESGKAGVAPPESSFHVKGQAIDLSQRGADGMFVAGELRPGIKEALESAGFQQHPGEPWHFSMGEFSEAVPTQPTGESQVQLTDSQRFQIDSDLQRLRNGELPNAEFGDAQQRAILTGTMDEFNAALADSVKGKGTKLNEAKTILLSDARFLPGVLDTLSETIESGQVTFNPVFGRLRSFNPFDVEQLTADAELKRTAQLIGRFMEGGVLRKEDEIKYAAMLPKTSDTQQLARNKLEGIRSMLLKKYDFYLEDLGNSGFDVGGFVADRDSLSGETGASFDAQTSQNVPAPPRGSINVRNASGEIGHIPMGQLQDALDEGFIILGQ